MKGRYHRDQEKFPVPNNNIKGNVYVMEVYKPRDVSTLVL